MAKEIDLLRRYRAGLPMTAEERKHVELWNPWLTPAFQRMQQEANKEFEVHVSKVVALVKGEQDDHQ